MAKILIIGGHGLGDCLMSLQCASILQRQSINPDVYISARDEIYKPLDYLFGNFFRMEQIDEANAADNLLLKYDAASLKSLSEGYDEVYYVIPDLLFNNKYALDYVKYSTSPQMVRDVRLLDGHERETGNIIYLGLMTTTEGYMYSEPMELAISIAYNLPNHTVYLPIVNTWAGKDIQPIGLPAKLPVNLKVDVNPNFNESLNVLFKSCYFVGTDNGPSHLAYHMAIPRLLLDPQFNRLPWMARWREDYLESIPIASSVKDVTTVVRTNITVPQTTLIPRMVCLVNGEADWTNLLWLKSQ